RARLLDAVSPGSEVSRGGFPQDLHIQGLIRHYLLQPGDLLLLLLEPLGLVSPQTAVFLTPAVVRLLRDPQLLRHLAYRLTLGNLNLGFTQLADDLFSLETLPGHPDIPRVEMLSKLEF